MATVRHRLYWGNIQKVADAQQIRIAGKVTWCCWCAKCTLVLYSVILLFLCQYRQYIVARFFDWIGSHCLASLEHQGNRILFIGSKNSKTLTTMANIAKFFTERLLKMIHTMHKHLDIWSAYQLTNSEIKQPCQCLLSCLGHVLQRVVQIRLPFLGHKERILWNYTASPIWASPLKAWEGEERQEYS